SPSTQPSAQPTGEPSGQPSSQPSGQPSAQPSSQPTATLVLLPAPNITAIGINASRTHLEVKVSIAGKDEASVYCAAFPLSSPQARSGLGLQPATPYVAYCATVSLDGLRLSDGAAWNTAVSQSTVCCKVASVSILRVLVEGALALEFAQLQLLLSLNNSAGGSVLYPSALQFAASNSALARTVALQAGTPGSYELSVVLGGAAGTEFQVAFEDGRSLLVLSNNAQPPTPELQSARFSNDGSLVLVAFSALTDKGLLPNNFMCTALFLFAGASRASCQWLDAKSVAIYPLYNSLYADDILRIGSSISLLASAAVRAQCSREASECGGWSSVVRRTLQTLAPLSALMPVVSIIGPSSIGACDELLLDVTSSSGAAGRPWKSDFTVRSTTGSAGAEEKLTLFLNTHSLTPPTPIPNSLLRGQGVVNVQLSLCNFLRACNTQGKAVVVLESEALTPTVTIFGAAQRTISRWSALQLTANAFTRSCTGVVSYDLQFSWSVYLDDGTGPKLALVSASQDPSVFKLAPFSLS
ncbi:hypothetical protein B484DRAFT_407340, partial [Ochromonadaceae sp. CCMP2298]